jgi:Ca2+-binding RTX toxin-like protein
VTGRGDGVHQSARWRLDGRNYDEGNFGCDVPVTTTPSYEVDISGRVEDRRLHLMFSLNGAEETNEEQDCGADYKANATRTQYLANSLRTVQGDGLVLDADRPVIGPLRLLEESGDQSNRRVILHEWEISLRAPDRPQDTGPNAPPGFGERPQRGDSSICTIEGTGGNDRLNGTRRNDVICGYGGRDRINGRGGHDLVYAGPGNDRVTGGGGLDTLYGNFGEDSFATRDGKRDKAHGGTGRDSASVDRRDRTAAVERVSRR